jgi:diguanylate cyclase (GGDEF)-like protein
VAGERPRSRASWLGSDPRDTRPGRALIADADRAARDAIAAALRGAGHAVETVDDGPAALDRVARGSIDLVLLDVALPRPPGLDVCRALKAAARCPILPVVLLVPRADVKSGVEGVRYGADDWAAKPILEEELTARCAALLRVKRVADQLADERDRLEMASVVDELTGLPNQRYAHTRLAQEWKRAERHHEPFACLLVELEGPWTPDDPCEPATLRAGADALRQCLRDADLVARVGETRFLVILPATHFAGSLAVAERVLREVRDLGAEADGREGRWMASTGVALFPSRDVRSKDAMLRAAEAALDQARREGGGRACIFQQQGYIHTPALGDAKGAPRSYDSRREPIGPASGRRDASGDHGGRKLP